MANFDDLVDPFDSPIPQKKTGLLRKAGDLAVGIGSGAVGATKALSDAFGADNAASKALGGVNEGLQGLLSPETVVRQYQQSRIMDEARGQGIGGQVAAGLKAFAVDPAQTIAQGAGSITPFIAAQFVPGVGQSATAARALQLGMGAGMGAGTAKGAIFDEVKKRELAAGRAPEQAQAAADSAQAYGGANTDQIALGAGLGLADAALGATPAAVSALRRSLGKEAIEGIGKPTTDGIIKAGIKGAAGEMPVEFAQGAQEQVAANIAAQRAGYDAGTWDGAISQGTLEGLAAAGPGAGFGILNRGQAPAAEQPPAQPPVAPTTTPGAPPAATPPTDPTLGQSLTGTPMADLMGVGGLTGGANPLQAGLSTLTSNNQMYPGMNTEPAGYTVDPETGAIIQAEPVGVRQVAEPVAQVEAPAPAAQAPVAPAQVAPTLGESLTGTPVADMLGSGGMSDPANPLQPVLDTRTPSQRMGLNPESGGLTAAAAIAVDSGASPVTAGMGLRALSGASPASQPVAEESTQQQAQPPAQQPILNNGKPFTLAEVGKANQSIGGTAVSVPGGWAIQPPATVQQPAATPATAMPTVDAPAASAQSAILGRNSQPIAEGGQPFATREEAKAEKRMQPLMRVAPAEGGGFILKPASERQLAAVEKAAKRLKYPSTGETGPRSLHGLILQIGGLASGAMPDVGFDLNPRVGNRRLFSPRGKTIEQAAMAAKQEGYIQDEDENTLIEALKRSLNVSPVYTPDGYEAMAEAQMQARYEDFLAAEQDGGAENDWSRLTPEELADTGYNDYDEATQAEIRALVAQAEALGIDAESILEDVARRTENATQKDYENAAKSAIEAAIRSSEESRSRDLGQAGAEAGPATADTPAAPAAVTGPASDVRARNLAALKQRMMGQAKPTPTTPPAQTKATPAPEAGPTNQGATNGQGQETLLKAEQPTGAAAMVSGAPVAPTRKDAITKASDAAYEVLNSGGTADAANRAATDSLIGDMGNTPGIRISVDAPAAVKAATSRISQAAPGLTSPTKADIEAQQARAEQAAKAKAAQDKADAARAAKERERKDVAAASIAAADTLELGQDAMANLTGQQDVFGAMEQEAEPAVSANTIFTEDAAAKARARLKSKLGRLNSGIDPEMMMDGITLAGYHIEKGARTFAAYARAMIEDLGDGVKPYLKSWYMGVKYDPRAASFDGMDGAAAVEAAGAEGQNGAVPRSGRGRLNPSTGAGKADARNAALTSVVRNGGNSTAVLTDIAKNSSNPAFKLVAKAILAKGLPFDLRIRTDFTDGKVAHYSTDGHFVEFDPGMPFNLEQVLLHEAVHAVTSKYVASFGDSTPLGKELAALFNLAEQHAKKTGADFYGLTNADEFLAEVMTNGDFAQWLDTVPVPLQKSALSRFVRAVARFFGIQKADGATAQAMDVFERIMLAQSDLQAAASQKLSISKDATAVADAYGVDTEEDGDTVYFGDAEVSLNREDNTYIVTSENEFTPDHRAAVAWAENNGFTSNFSKSPPANLTPVESMLRDALEATGDMGAAKDMAYEALRRQGVAVKWQEVVDAAKKMGRGTRASKGAVSTSRHADLLRAWLRESGNRDFLRDGILDRRGADKFDYELRSVPVADVTPSQTGEDYLNASSEYTARQIASETIDTIHRREDVMPIILDENLKIIDGNHRHAASTVNGATTIPALVRTGSGTGKISGVEAWIGADSGVKQSRTDTTESPRTPASTIRAAINKAYGNLLDKLEAKGLVTIAQTEREAIEAAAQARADKTGGDVEQIKRQMLASVQMQRVWHGSPHRGIQQFSTEKIGTGEGAQAYGWGLYFASKRAIAEHYRKILSGFFYAGTDANEEWFVFSDDDKKISGPYGTPDEASSAAEEAQKKAGQLYEVEIPEDSELLMWDKPISEQNGKIIKLLFEKYGIDVVKQGYSDFREQKYFDINTSQYGVVRLYQDLQIDDDGAVDGESYSLDKDDVSDISEEEQNRIVNDFSNLMNGTGESAYGRLVQMFDGDLFGSEDPAKYASLYLKSIGIPGIKYLDGTSRKYGEGSHNYVIFDGADTQIVDVKYSANGNIEGFFDRQTGKSFLVADNLTAASAPGTLMHEVGIHMAADGKLEPLFKRAGSLLKTGTQNEFIQRVKARMARAGETSDEEAAAYIVTEYENDRAKAPITIGKWIADLTAAVRAWLFSKGIILKAEQLTVADIAAVARANARSMARGGPNGGPGGGQSFSRNVGDATPDEAQRVQASIEGKSLIDAAMFLTRSSNKANAAIAQKVADKLKRMEEIGVDLKLHVVHRGDMAPAALANSRGYTESGFDSKGRDVAVWLNGADVDGKVGTEEEVLLHELVHAATTGMVHYGAMNPDTQAGSSMKDLMAVTDAIADHIKQRFADAEAGKVTLTEFELDMREGANNAFRSDDEVLAWALSNAEAQQYLEGIPYKSGSLWSNFVRSVRALLGMSPEMDTALSEVLRVAERLLTDDPAKTGRSAFWHKRGLRMIQQQGRGSIVQTQTRSDTDIRFSRAADMAGNAIDKAKQTADKAMGKDFPRAASMPDLSDDQRSLLGKVGASQSPASDAIKAATDRAGLKIRQGMVDRFAALKELDEKALGQNFIADSITNSAWVLAKMSSAGAGALNAMMKSGRIEMDAQQKVIGLKGAPNGGLTASLQKLGGPAEVERFFAWVAANRSHAIIERNKDAIAKTAEAKRELKTIIEMQAIPGKTAQQVSQLSDARKEWEKVIAKHEPFLDVTERLFTEDEVAAGRTLNTGNTEEGKVRPALYSQVHAEFQQYRDDVLAIAEQAGIINGENRAMWRDEFYVPFYRVMEDDADRGRSGGNGLSRQEAYKKLKGGKQNLNDLMENTLMNFHHLLSASLKNQAAVQAIKNAETVGIARKVPEARRDTKTSTFVLVDGKKVFYEVDDPLVFESITTLADPGLNNTAVRVMGAFKRLFTNMTTATPQFIIANTFRDLLQASATSPTSKNIAKNLKEGIQSYRDEKTRAEMLASGGAFSFGHIYGMHADEVKASLQKTVAGAGLISSPSMIPSILRKGWDAWSNITDLSENASRAATYTQNVDQMGKLRAAFEARDVMDFSQHGAWPAVRLLVRIVPFLNARLQGLDKLYRSGLKPSILTAMGKGTDTDKQAAARFAMVTGALTLATMALYLVNADDDEYKKLEEWQKDTYWFIRIGENAFFLPKPFEVGAIATMAERTLQQAMDDKATGKLFRERMWEMLMQTFAFNPTPQMFQPLIDVYSNKDAFTGRDIESAGMERMSTGLRSRDSTTAPATALSAVSRVFGDESAVAVSPVQADHLIKGYLGGVGATAAGWIDTMYRAATGQSSPDKAWSEYQPIRRFYRDLDVPVANTRYTTLFYDGLKEANRVYADVMELQKLGRTEEAEALAAEKRNPLQMRIALNAQQRRLTEINNRMKEVRRSDKDGEWKRRELDLLNTQKAMITERMGKRIEDARAGA